MDDRLEYAFSNEGMQRVHKYMDRFSTSVPMGETPKDEGSLLTSVSMLLKVKTNRKLRPLAGGGEERELSCSVGRDGGSWGRTT